MKSLAPLPDAFDCPYRRQCWQRELFRWVAIVAVSAIVSWGTGCSMKLLGPGFSFESRGFWPMTQPVEKPPTP